MPPKRSTDNKAPARASRKRGATTSAQLSDDDDDVNGKKVEPLQDAEGEGSSSSASSDSSESEDDNEEGDPEEAKAKAASARRKALAEERARARKKPNRRGRKARGSSIVKGSDEDEEEGKTKASLKKPARLSAATLKTRMSPSMLQNRMARRIIWNNIRVMLERRGYEWVADRAPPADHEELLPNNKGYLGLFHMHAVDRRPTGTLVPSASALTGIASATPSVGTTSMEIEDQSKSCSSIGGETSVVPSTVEKSVVTTANAKAPVREPIYVVFCAKAGEPTLNSLTYPSRHIVLVSDSLTGRARAALSALESKMPPTTLEGAGSAEAAYTAGPPSAASIASLLPQPPAYILNQVYMEAFQSVSFMFDLLQQHYLQGVRFSLTTPEELERVFEAYEPGRHLDRFPKILDIDPVVRYLRLPVGGVLKQERLSNSAGVHTTYRLISSKASS